jgi:hypothetical protein
MVKRLEFKPAAAFGVSPISGKGLPVREFFEGLVLGISGTIPEDKRSTVGRSHHINRTILIQVTGQNVGTRAGSDQLRHELWPARRGRIVLRPALSRPHP